MPRMAPKNPLERQDGTLRRSVGLQSLQCVGGATGVETASASHSAGEGMEQRGNHPAVESDRNAEQEGHEES